MLMSKQKNTLNLAINGFGRIGRSTFKALLKKKNLKIVAINDLTDTQTLAHLLQYDSAYGKYQKQVDYTKDSIVVDGKKYQILAQRDPTKLPWRDLDIDIVLECTGRFRTKELSSQHLEAGAKKVIISAPTKDKIKTIVLGVNETSIKKSDKILSMASCTTNCIAPVAKIIVQNFGVKKAFMTTIHSYTADQNLVDGPHKDLRRARAAAVNIVPTTTGAAIATAKTIPILKNKFTGMAIRVPTLVGSLSDMVFNTTKKTNIEKVNNVFKKASQSARYKNILDITDKPIVSTDIIGNSHSSIIDLSFTNVIGGNLVKIISWYDNEYGYSNRLADLSEYIKNHNLI